MADKQKIEDLKEWGKKTSGLENATVQVKPIHNDRYRVDVWENVQRSGESLFVTGSRIASSYFVEYLDEIKDLTL